jgi:hypothetical protein
MIQCNRSTGSDERDGVLQQWAARHGYVDGETLRQQLGLSELEWQAATWPGSVIPRVQLPIELQEQLGILNAELYRGDIQLSADDRAKIADATHLTKQQACARLQISARTFDRWKQALGVRRVCRIQYGNSYLVNGYRQSDIDHMGVQMRAKRGAQK